MHNMFFVSCLLIGVSQTLQTNTEIAEDIPNDCVIFGIVVTKSTGHDFLTTVGLQLALALIMFTAEYTLLLILHISALVKGKDPPFPKRIDLRGRIYYVHRR